MNRRNFISGLLATGAGFVILPSADTYLRLWVPQRIFPVVPFRQCGSLADFPITTMSPDDLSKLFSGGEVLEQLLVADLEMKMCGYAHVGFPELFSGRYQ